MAVDLHLVGRRFNWASSIFYIVYLVVEVPSNIILKKVGPRYYRTDALSLSRSAADTDLDTQFPYSSSVSVSCLCVPLL